ncbi:MAG TPA: phage portal protein, partial [Planctomycetota bacterium]|nr:phage portal protein [Planctomycetota bacterium]
MSIEQSTFSGVVSAEAFAASGLMLASYPAPAAKEMSLGQTAAEWFSAWNESGRRGYDGPDRPASQSVWAYACISAIAGAVGSVPLAVSRNRASGTRGLWNLRHVRTGPRAVRKVAAAHARAVEGEIVESGPLVELLGEPMPGLTQRQWIERIVGYLYACGRVHVLKAELVGSRPTMLVPIPGSRTKPLYAKAGQYKRIVGWELAGPDGDRYAVPAEMLITLTLFSADDPDAGLAPHEPGRLSIAADYNAARHVAASFSNGCEPGGIIKIEGPYSAEVNSQIRQAWQQRHGGADNARKLAVLFGNADYKTVAQTMTDMGFPTVKQSSREEICATYRVPASVAGFFGTTGDASAYVLAEQQRFWQDTAGVLCEKLATAINIGVAPLVEPGLEVWADLEDVPVYQAMRQANMRSVGELWTKGVPLADLSDMLDLGVPERPQHRIGYLPAGLIPAADIAGPPNGGETAPPPQSDSIGQETTEPGTGNQEPGKANNGTGNQEPGTRRSIPGSEFRAPGSAVSRPSAADVLAASLWKAWEASWRPTARAMEQMLRSHLLMQERRVLAALKEAELGTGSAAASSPGSRFQAPGSAVKSPEVVARVLFDIFGSRESAQALEARVRVFMADARELGIRQALAESGLAGDALAQALREMTANPEIINGLRADQVRISTLVNNRTRNLLRAELQTGLEAGEGIRDLASRVQGVMQG